MSYDDAVQALRRVDVQPPALSDVESRRQWMQGRQLDSGPVRIALLGAAVSVVAYLFLTVRPLMEFWPQLDRFAGMDRFWFGVSMVSVATLLPAGLLVWAMRLIGRVGVGPQMLTRAVLWSNLVVGTLIAGNFVSSVDRIAGMVIAVACATAIVAVGSRGLDDVAPGDLFAPVRFRGPLLLALVMAFADAQTLMFSAVMQLRIGTAGWNLIGMIEFAAPITVAAGVMVLTVWGLYRLRTWALLLNLAANIAIAYFALDGTLHIATPVAAGLALTAAVQMFLPVPILATALGEKRAGQPLLRGYAPRLVPIGVVAIAALAVALAFTVERPRGWVMGSRAFVRGLHRSPKQAKQPRTERPERAAEGSGRGSE